MRAGFKAAHPWPIRALNRVGNPLTGIGAAPTLDPQWLRSAARRATGLEWVADAYLDDALDALATSLRNDAKLSFLGRKMVQVRLVGMLSTRLRLRELIRTNPGIAQLPVEPPIVIVGLQRTGTTLLHRLLAADPSAGSMSSWEGASPLPHPQQPSGAADLRIAQAAKDERSLKYLAPQFFAIHSVEAEAPEEDVLLLDFALHSQMPEVMFHVPGYAKWLADQDMTPAYELHRLLLQVLQWQRPRGRWVLKTPAHLEHLDVLLRVYPGAVVVWTHRDPAQTTASSSSMLAHYQALFSDRVDHHELARYWLGKNAQIIDRAIAVRAEHPAAFVDINYTELLDDPIAAVQRIYHAADRRLSDDALTAMRASLQENRQHKHGEHRYSLAQFGLTITEVDAAYRRYIDHFAIQTERGGVRGDR
ncbi:putative sulfotransferase [Mycobacteroides abscessus 5S-0422]|uniref:Sulfotransferase family protein n=1 Tax=Mycobacteroides abscessus subsp. bolletii 1513 TaxID=1299321 RepID=X8DHS5_9MYCO|nr:sulfotransferase [Mycobacteroides abscessus]EUA68192.1 sulfotransferase family protein [Mycobacteroides abscessus subsp. bolletii 1513]EIU04684.1 putative sulfotransferase [Mycobacteroides abscessus 5S-0422]EIU12038.1 putative sulfotransferase [Mycobacteroides abscessus 5S-0304]EIU22062.1 putative sulfotransferase [Mycobacteroides abscessus 5S-0708]EIU24095.1 putative sulfotransferase [Mycobacteroides abscessus 5S-0817]